MKKHYFLFIALIPSLLSAQWVQVGNDIWGNPGDANGIFLTAMNDQGNRIVVANPYSGTGASNAGHVRVYDLVENDWVQVGPYIQGEVYSGEAFGYSIDMNASGEIIAAGIRESGGGQGRCGVFEYDGSNWLLKGSYLDGQSTGDAYGTAISLSDDGLTLAVSAPGDDANGTSAGQVRVYQFQSGNWVQVGQDINGSHEDELGNVISLNANGDILAIAAYRAETSNGYSTGKVLVYENQNDVWVKLGLDIKGDNISDILGTSIDLNAAGDRLAIGIPGVDELGRENIGAVRVYEFSGGSWNVLGEDILGYLRQNGFGYSVGINDAGDAIIIGGPYSDSNNPYEGEVWFYKYEGQHWYNYGPSLFGTEVYDRFGANVSISSSGDIIGVTSWGSEINPGDREGKVSVYNTEQLILGNQESMLETSINLYPNPTNNVLYLESSLEPITEITIYTQLGQVLYNSMVDKKKTTISMSGYAKGIYFIKVNVNDKISIKKFIKN